MLGSHSNEAMQAVQRKHGQGESLEENRTKKEEEKCRVQGGIMMPVSACAKGLLKTGQRHVYDNNAGIRSGYCFKLRSGCSESNIVMPALLATRYYTENTCE